MRTARPGAREAVERGSDRTRRVLIEAAARVFADAGFGGARVEAIARAAGVNKAMINYHFGGKRKLYAAVFGTVIETLHGRLGPAREAGAPADLRLRRFIEAYRDTALAHPRFPAMMLREAIAGGRHMDRSLLSRLFSVFLLAKEIVEQGIREGVFRPVNPLLTYLSIVGSLAFFFSTEPLRARVLARELPQAPDPDPASFARHLEDQILFGIRADRGLPGKGRS